MHPWEGTGTPAGPIILYTDACANPGLTRCAIRWAWGPFHRGPAKALVNVASTRKCIASGAKSGPCIVSAPQGYRNSWWCALDPPEVAVGRAASRPAPVTRGLPRTAGIHTAAGTHASPRSALLGVQQNKADASRCVHTEATVKLLPCWSAAPRGCCHTAAAAARAGAARLAHVRCAASFAHGRGAGSGRPAARANKQMPTADQQQDQIWMISGCPALSRHVPLQASSERRVCSGRWSAWHESCALSRQH